MRTVDDKVKAKRLQEDLLRGEDLAGNFVDFLERKVNVVGVHYEKDNGKTYWTTFGNLSNIYSLCLGLAYPSYVPELPSALFSLCSKEHACGRDGLGDVLVTKEAATRAEQTCR